MAEQELTELSGARTSWLGPERPVEEELGASESQSGDAQFPKKKTASA